MGQGTRAGERGLLNGELGPGTQRKANGGELTAQAIEPAELVAIIEVKQAENAHAD
jgi:hypothetical protein